MRNFFLHLYKKKKMKSILDAGFGWLRRAVIKLRYTVTYSFEKVKEIEEVRNCE
jgi:hypothetical protein